MEWASKPISHGTTDKENLDTEQLRSGQELHQARAMCEKSIDALYQKTLSAP
jgi:hypothetical protein